MGRTLYIKSYLVFISHGLAFKNLKIKSAMKWFLISKSSTSRQNDDEVVVGSELHEATSKKNKIDEKSQTFTTKTLTPVSSTRKTETNR